MNIYKLTVYRTPGGNYPNGEIRDMFKGTDEPTAQTLYRVTKDILKYVNPDARVELTVKEHTGSYGELLV